MYAVCGQHIPAIQVLLAAPGINVNVRNVNGWAAVHWAVASRRARDSPDILAMLVGPCLAGFQGCRPGWRHPSLFTHACRTPCVPVTRTQVTAGAYPDMPTIRGWGPLHLAAALNHSAIFQ